VTPHVADLAPIPEPVIRGGRVVYPCSVCGLCHEFATTAVLCELSHEED
jgi:hypothetical protein